MFDKLLIANRGEIAVRIQRACKDMGIATVAVHSVADEHAMHVRLADESVCIGPAAAPESYLNIPAIISACEITRAEAVHPGYGFLSENARFASILEEHGIAFVGPTSEHIRVMGDKIAAKKKAEEMGLPITPGSKGALTDAKEAIKLAEEFGYPVLIKAASGGGGRGMQLVNAPDEMAKAMATAKNEAGRAFGDETIYLEKYLAQPRHIEVQVLGDGKGKAVHLGERDCSLQRRHQKILEESPSPALNDCDRKKICELAADACARLHYRGAGTFEFLYENGEFYFIEMNTRLQVEHPVTEALTGVDLVREQIRIAAGLPMELQQEQIGFTGHAIECRINAESPLNFRPSPGEVKVWHPPGGPGVRIDSSMYTGCRIPVNYDSMIGKLIVHGRNRTECMMRLRRALSEFVVEGIETTIPLFEELLAHPDIANGSYDIHWLEEYLAKREDA